MEIRLRNCFPSVDNHDMPYGARECAFRDPAGNLMRISQTAR